MGSPHARRGAGLSPRVSHQQTDGADAVPVPLSQTLGRKNKPIHHSEHRTTDRLSGIRSLPSSVSMTKMKLKKCYSQEHLAQINSYEKSKRKKKITFTVYTQQTEGQVLRSKKICKHHLFKQRACEGKCRETMMY